MKEIVCEFDYTKCIGIDDIDKYICDEHFLDYTIQDLRKRPSDNIVIWGTYNNAIRLRDYLSALLDTSKIRACVVNKQYINNNLNNVICKDDFPKVPLEDWLETMENTTILVDFSFYKSQMLEKYENKVDRVYVGDFMGTIILDSPYIITKDMYLQNRSLILNTLIMLEDEESRREYVTFIMQKNRGFYSKPYHFDEPQYFDKSLINLDSQCVYVDCGAYTGDTIKGFQNFTGNQYEYIYAFEMDEENYHRLYDNFAGQSNISCIKKGVGDSCGTINALSGKNSSSRISDCGDTQVEITSIDSELLEKNVSMIKMDIEGFEFAALKGAAETISCRKPILAISLYHKFSDLFLVPKYIKELNRNYRLYFRNYHNSASECVLYAINKE